MTRQEAARARERGRPFGNRGKEPGPDVHHAGAKFEVDIDVGIGERFGEVERVVHQDFGGARLDEDRRRPPKVGEGR